MGVYANVQRTVPTHDHAVPGKIYAAIRNASSRTGVDFAYLMEKAEAESSFDTNAKAATSSAEGLFQFIDQTWLNMVATHGQKHGLARYAAMIDRRPDGSVEVHDPAMKQRILDLRRDPKTAALMAAEFAAGNRRYLEQHTNGTIGKTELYLAHFLGAKGAARFLNTDQTAPGKDIFPEAARANKNVFFDPATGQPRTLKQIYAFFDKKFSGDTVRMTARHPAEQPRPNPAPPSGTITDDLRLDGEQLAMTFLMDMMDRPAAARPVNNGLGYTNQLIDPVTVLLLSSLAAPGDVPKQS